METIFDEKYYNTEDKAGKDLEDQQDINLKLMQDDIDDIGIDGGDEDDDSYTS